MAPACADRHQDDDALTGFVDDRLRAGVTRALVRLRGRTGLVLSREFS
jgi:hypothetical protein